MSAVIGQLPENNSRYLLVQWRRNIVNVGGMANINVWTSFFITFIFKINCAEKFSEVRILPLGVSVSYSLKVKWTWKISVFYFSLLVAKHGNLATSRCYEMKIFWWASDLTLTGFGFLKKSSIVQLSEEVQDKCTCPVNKFSIFWMFLFTVVIWNAIKGYKLCLNFL